MDTIFSRHRNAIVLIGVLLVQVVVLAYQVRRPNSEVPLIREWVSAIVSPPQRLVAGGFHGIGSFWDNYINLHGARERNEALEVELGKQRIMNQELRTQLLEMQRVQSLVQFQETSPSTLMVARIIGSGATDQSRVVFLDKGREDGVRANMGVITAEGVVGKVQRAFEGSSQVLLITDEESGVGVLLESSRVHGVLRGQNASRLKLNYVLNDEKVQPGERVFTSGEDKVFPRGLPVGTVVEASAAQDFKHIIVEPSAKINRLENVLIVLRGREVAMTAAGAPAPGIAKSEPSASPNGTTNSTSAGDSEPVDTDIQPEPGAAAAVATPDPMGAGAPGTDADKIREAYRQKMAASQPKGVAVKPAVGAATSAGVATPGATSPGGVATRSTAPRGSTTTPRPTPVAGVTPPSRGAAPPAAATPRLKPPAGSEPAIVERSTPAKKPPVNPPPAPATPRPQP